MSQEPDLAYSEGTGWVDRNTIEGWTGDRFPPIGTRLCIAPLDSITRALWGQTGTVEKHMEACGWYSPDRFWLKFDEPVKCVGAVMAGVWLSNEHVMG